MPHTATRQRFAPTIRPDMPIHRHAPIRKDGITGRGDCIVSSGLREEDQTEALNLFEPALGRTPTPPVLAMDFLSPVYLHMEVLGLSTESRSSPILSPQDAHFQDTYEIRAFR